MYWIETTLTNEELANITPPSEYTKGLIPIKELVNRNFEYQPLIDSEGWRVVYNGIRTDIRNRIQQHLRSKGNGTGRLGLNAYPELRTKNWRVSYYFLTPEEYKIYSILFEKGWRGFYGCPILCRN